MSVRARAFLIHFTALYRGKKKKNKNKKRIKVRSVFVIGVKTHAVKMNYFRVS